MDPKDIGFTRKRRTNFQFTLWLSIVFPIASILGSIAKKTKLCGNESCTEKLFEGKFHRSSTPRHESFLSPSENDVVNVYAIKFSDRTDLMEGALEREPEKKGNFFKMHINLDGYVEFLKNAIKSNKTMFLISMDPYDHPAHRLIGQKSALPELIKDYEVHANRLAEEKQLPPPEKIDYEALGYKPEETGHGESHNSVPEHSHNVEHGHSHDHLYTHMHEHEQEQVDYHIHHQPAAPLTETAVPPPPVTDYSKDVPKVHSAQAVEQLDLGMASNGISGVLETLVISGPSQISVSEQTLEPSKSVQEITVNGVSTTGSTPGSQKLIPEANNVPSATVLVEQVLKHDVQGKQEMPVEHVQRPSLPSHPNLQDEEQISVASTSSPLPEIDNDSSWSSPASKSQIFLSSQTSNTAEMPSIRQTSHHPVADVPETSPSSLPATSTVTVKESLPAPVPQLPTVWPDRTSAVTAIENEPSKQITVSPATTPPQNVLSPSEKRSNIDQTSIDSIGEGNSAEARRQSNNAKIEMQMEGEVRTDIMEEDGLGYCIKDDCNRVYSSPQTDKSELVYLMVAGKCLSKLISLLRYLLPAPIKHIDDAGVVVTFFVPICLLIHLIRVLVFEDTNERDIFDRRTLHNALTAIRERDVKMKLLHAEMEKGRSAVNSEMEKKFESFQLQIGEQLLEIQQLKAKCGDLEEENNNLKAEKDETSQLIEKEWLRSRDLTEHNKKLGEKIEMLMKELSDMSAAMEAIRKENERLDSDVSNKNAQLTRFESEAKSHSLEMKNLRDQLKTSAAESKMFQQRVEELQNETVQLSEIIKEMHDAGNIIGGATAAQLKNDERVCENGNDESGWSDFGEFGMDDSAAINKKSKKQCSSALWSSSTDIIEVAKLRAQLKNVEADLDRAKLTLQKQENEREHLIRKVELAESDATKRLREVEVKEVERVEAHNQFKRILSMVEEREAKLRNSEELIEKLRNDVVNWQEKVRQMEEEKRLVEIKFSETEQELKRLKTDYSRLETRKFHEMRECKQTIAALQQSLEQARLLNPSSNIYDNANLHNLSASSSDRDCCAPMNAGLVVPPLPTVRPLWTDESNEMLPGGESSLLRNVGPAVNDRAVGNSNLLYKKTRRSFKDREFNSGAVDGVQSRHKKETRRMRSRSQGRHPFNVDYFPSLGYPARTDFYTNTMLSKQHSKSGTMYYSSGGSNSGRSPPPEIALLSGVPPPGPMIKKPTPRPKSSTVIVERRQN